MSKLLEKIDDRLAEFIGKQHVFFVATAPIGPAGHVNVSPKGGEAFRVLGAMEVAYQDYTGSGAETVAHLRENGRIAIMFCAFEGPPMIVRLHGHGQAITPDDSRFAGLAARFPPNPGTRALIHVTVTRVSSSCGFSVPFYEYQGPRELLDAWARQQGQEKLEAYRKNKNEWSIDHLPAFCPASERSLPPRHFLLFYEKAPGYAEAQQPWEAEHRRHVEAALRDGRVLLAGSLDNPSDGSALLVFRAQDPKEVEAFAAADPYVRQGIVIRWQARPWHTLP